MVQQSRPADTKISRRAADRIRAGHAWVYRSDLLDPLSPEAHAPGTILTVADPRNLPLGSGLWSQSSEIAIRLVSRRPGLDRTAYLADLRTRFHAALALRRELVPEAFHSASGTDACRLVFSEADSLPGIVLDRYGPLAVLQLLIQGTAQPDVRDTIREVIAAEPWAASLVERGDRRLSQLEQLDSPPSNILWSRNPAASSLQSTFQINGLQFAYDAAAGQKTGAFLDQRLNYAAAAQWAARTGKTARALDVCTYHGGFALHLSRVCSRVTGVDASRAALETADRNLEANAATISANTDWVEADAFELLRDWQDSGQRFDTIVLDPPAFAKTKRASTSALRGYKELNLRALKMLGSAPTPAHPYNSGLLVTCSCSYHVSLAEFVEIVRSAAIDAGRRVQLLETRGAAPDHPAILTLPVTSYLKCLILRVG